jgi:hypothetical protein
MKGGYPRGNDMATADLPPVSHLSVESKRKLLAVLARDLLASSPGPAGVLDAGGGVFVYQVPADARAKAEKAVREATPEQRAEYRRRIATRDQSISFEEALRLPPDPDPEPSQSR